jgi:class 3 adenylate cyclase
LNAQNKQLEKLIKQRKQELETEKKKSDDLLLTILPKEVASELKNTGKTKVRFCQNVSVLFFDLVIFTGISAKLSPTELIPEIHFYFEAFDKMVEANGVEKIKTIGDVYMAVCGIPHPSHKHASNLV